MSFLKRCILKNVGVKRWSLGSVLKYLRKTEEADEANMANFCQLLNLGHRYKEFTTSLPSFVYVWIFHIIF